MADEMKISLEDAAKLYLGSILNLTFEEYRAKRNQAKSVIQRAINSGQISAGNDWIDFTSFYNWMNADKVQVAFYVRSDVWDKFRQAHQEKNLSYEVEKLMAKSME